MGRAPYAGYRGHRRAQEPYRMWRPARPSYIPPVNWRAYPRSHQAGAGPRLVAPRVPSRNRNFCYRCRKEVNGLARHVRRVHDLKEWGYKCVVCHHFESCEDRGLILKHVTTSHPDASPPEQYILKEVVDTPYQDVVSCPAGECSFKAESNFKLGIHYNIAHPVAPQVVESYTTCRATPAVTTSQEVKQEFYLVTPASGHQPMEIDLRAAEANLVSALSIGDGFQVTSAPTSTSPPVTATPCSSMAASTTTTMVAARTRPVTTPAALTSSSRPSLEERFQKMWDQTIDLK